MSIYKRKNTWRAEVWIDSKRIVTKRGFSSKGQAKAWHDQTMLEFSRNPSNFQKEEKFLFDDLLDKYVSIHLPTISSISRMRYEVEIKYRIKPFFQYRKLESITPMVIESYRSSVMKKLSIKSVNMSVNVLFGIFKKGEEWGMIQKNPVRLKNLKIAGQKCAWWEKKEHVLAFLEASKLSHYQLAFRLALECGLRLGEIVGLSKEDVSLDRCQLHIHRQWIDKEQAYGPTKGRKERIVSFDPTSDLKQVLREAILKSPHPEAIIVTPKGIRASNRKLATHHFNKVIRAAGVPEIRFHDLRHTFASWYMIEVGDIWSLKGILGHVDIQTTQRYAHLSQSHQKAPTLKWSLEKSENFSRHFHATFSNPIQKAI